MGLALWIVPSVLALFVVAYFGTLAGGGGYPEATLDAVARGTLATSAHIEWSAPLLVTAAFALAAICAAPVQERVGFGSPVPLFALAATAVSIALTVWFVCALATLPRVGVLTAENPLAPEQFAAVSGIFLAAPLGVVAGTSAGRFQLLPLPARLAWAHAQATQLETEVEQLTPRSSSRPARMGWYRALRYGAPAVLAGALVVTVLAAAQEPEEARPFGATLVAIGLLFFSISAFCAAVGMSIVLAPTVHFARGDSVRRQPTVMGWITGILLIVGIVSPLLFAASIAGTTTSSTSLDDLETRALWVPVIASVVGSAAYAVLLLTPVAQRGHREAARRARAKQLASARASVARLEAQQATPVAAPTS